MSALSFNLSLLAAAAAAENSCPAATNTFILSFTHHSRLLFAAADPSAIAAKKALS
jgi:hypothetical protein